MGNHLRHRTGTHRATHPIGTGGKKQEKPYKNELNITKLREETEKIKDDYNLGEKQLKRYTQEAIRTAGNPAEIFLRKLEMRLDNVIYRAGLAQSRTEARELISAGGITINGTVVDDASYQMSTDDAVALRHTDTTPSDPMHHKPPQASWLTRHSTSVVLDHIPQLSEMKGYVRAKIDDVLRYYAVI